VVVAYHVWAIRGSNGCPNIRAKVQSQLVGVIPGRVYSYLCINYRMGCPLVSSVECLVYSVTKEFGDGIV